MLTLSCRLTQASFEQKPDLDGLNELGRSNPRRVSKRTVFDMSELVDLNRKAVDER